MNSVGSKGSSSASSKEFLPTSSATAHLRQEPPGRPPRYKGAADASERATGAESPLPEGIRCTQCGCAFVDAAAYDAHRPDGKCVKPTDAGLVVAPRIRLTWSVPVRVPVDSAER